MFSYIWDNFQRSELQFVLGPAWILVVILATAWAISAANRWIRPTRAFLILFMVDVFVAFSISNFLIEHPA